MSTKANVERAQDAINVLADITTAIFENCKRILFFLEVFVLLDMLGFPYEDEFWMLACIAWREGFALHACHFVCRGVSVMHDLVDTGYRDVITRFEFLRHREPPYRWIKCRDQYCPKQPTV